MLKGQASTRSCRHATGSGISRASLWIVAKAKLHANLKMTNLAIDDVTLDLRNLEPVKMPERFRCCLNTVLDGVLHTGLRRSDDLGDAVNMISHSHSPFAVPRGPPEEILLRQV
jgi:hypothetical protein